MSALSKIMPETLPAMASVPFEIAQAMDGPRFYVAGNRLLKNLKSIRESAALFRENFKTLPRIMERLSDSDIDAWTDQMLSMEGHMVELRAQARHAIIPTGGESDVPLLNRHPLAWPGDPYKHGAAAVPAHRIPA